MTHFKQSFSASAPVSYAEAAPSCADDTRALTVFMDAMEIMASFFVCWQFIYSIIVFFPLFSLLGSS